MGKRKELFTRVVSHLSLRSLWPPEVFRKRQVKAEASKQWVNRQQHRCLPKVNKRKNQIQRRRKLWQRIERRTNRQLPKHKKRQLLHPTEVNPELDRRLTKQQRKYRSRPAKGQLRFNWRLAKHRKINHCHLAKVKMKLSHQWPKYRTK